MTETRTQRYVVKHAYPKRPSEWTTMGADHYTVTVPLHFGRLHRELGDALCKPSRKFWGLDTNRPDDQVATCKRCIEIAARLEAGADTEVADRPRVGYPEWGVTISRPDGWDAAEEPDRDEIERHRHCTDERACPECTA